MINIKQLIKKNIFSIYIFLGRHPQKKEQIKKILFFSPIVYNKLRNIINGYKSALLRENEFKNISGYINIHVILIGLAKYRKYQRYE